MGVPLSTTLSVEKQPPKASAVKVDITRTTPLYPRSVYIQWVVVNPDKGTDYLFNIWRSGSSEGPWEQVLLDSPDFFYADTDFPANYEDRKPGLMTLNDTIYYKVEAKVGGVVVGEEVQLVQAALDRRRRGIHRKLVRDAEVYLRKVMGTQVAILKRKQWGEVCPHCVSSTGMSVRAHCGYCHGTGILHGYWNPVYGYSQRSATPIERMTSSEGTVEIHRLTAIMWHVPKVEPKDVLVFLRDDKRYIIEAVSPTSIHGVTVHQECSVSELARSSSEWNIKIDPWHDPKWF